MIRAVIFDLGHTVWDFAPSIEARRHMVLRLHAAMERAFGNRSPSPRGLDRALHHSVTQWTDRWYNNPHTLEQPPTETVIRDMLDRLGLVCDDAVVAALTDIAFGREIEMPSVPADSLSAIATLDARGLSMGCVTNTLTLSTAIEDIIAALGLGRYLRTIVCSSTGGYRKPHLSLFRSALDGLNVSPQEAVFVGDRITDDIGGAKNAGMHAVLTHQYRQEQPEGGSHAPDAVIKRLADLPQALKAMEQRLRGPIHSAVS
jgi:HAD superfamily hydrolase (TIGR01662 family)